MIKNSEPAQVRKSIVRRVITSNSDRCERLTKLVASQLTQAELLNEVGEEAAFFTDKFPRSAEEGCHVEFDSPVCLGGSRIR